jgi:hypothetical protein
MSSRRRSTRSSDPNTNSNTSSTNAINDGNSTNSNHSSIRTAKSPVWRPVPVISSKNTPSAATLSYVFAEPELAKKSSRGTMRNREAVASSGDDPANPSKTSLVNLNGMWSGYAVVLADSELHTGASTSSSTSTAQHMPNEYNRGDVHTHQLGSLVTTNASEPSFVSSKDSNLDSSPTNPKVSLTTSKSATSWFGSLSRHKGKQSAEVIRTNVNGNVDSSTTMKDSSEKIRSKLAGVLDLHDRPPTPISGPTPNTAAAPLPFPSSPSLGPCRSTAVPPSPAPPATVPPLLGKQAPTLVVDLAPSPEAETGSSTGVVSSIFTSSDAAQSTSGTNTAGGESPTEPRARLSSLNPSTSRFALSLPLLLGRASAGAKVQAKDDIGQIGGHDPSIYAWLYACLLIGGAGSTGNGDGITTMTLGQTSSTSMPALPSAPSSHVPPLPAAVMKPTNSETSITAVAPGPQPAPPASVSSASWWGYGPASASESKSSTSITTPAPTSLPQPPPEAGAIAVATSDLSAPLAVAPAVSAERNDPSTLASPASQPPQPAPPSTTSSWWGYGPASASVLKTNPSDLTSVSTSISTPPPATADVASTAPTPVSPEPTSTSIPASAEQSEPQSTPLAPTLSTSPVDLPASTSSSAWWGYLGWGGSTSAPPSSQPLATNVKEGEEEKGSKTIHVAPLAAITADASPRGGSGPSSSTVEGPERDRKNEQARTNEDKNLSKNGIKGTSGSGAGATLMAMTTNMVPVPVVTVSDPVDHGVSSGTVPVECGETGQREGKGEAEGEDRKRDGAVTAAGGVWYSPWSWYGTAGSTTTDGGLRDIRHGDNGIAIDGIGGANEDGDGNKRVGTSVATGGDTGGDRDLITGTSAAGPSRGVGDRHDGGGSESAGGGDGVLRPEIGMTSVTLDMPVADVESAAPGQETENGGGGETNPVGSTFVTSRAGWASFFSSRSLVVKRITGSGDVKRDEHGAEVMDIDEPDEKNVVPNGDGVEKRTELGAVADESERTPSKKAKDCELTRGRDPATPKPIPPLTISDSVKRQTIQSNLAKSTSAPASPVNAAHIKSKKSTSPAPSTKSASGSGRSSSVPLPKPPNLVLPMWQDTFHTAPRDVLPPEPETAFNRAMGFVSGVLFASDGAGGGTGSRGNKHVAKRREDEWSHFGRELPRAWDVVERRVGKERVKETGVLGKLVGKGKRKASAGAGASVDPDVLRGCKRVVVIGIHGWFPGMFVISLCFVNADSLW